MFLYKKALIVLGPVAAVSVHQWLIYGHVDNYPGKRTTPLDCPPDHTHVTAEGFSCSWALGPPAANHVFTSGLADMF